MAALRRAAKKTLIVILLGAVAGFAVAKTFVWYEAHRAATRLADWLAPYASLRWESVRADVGGEIRLRGLSIHPNGLDDGIYIDLLTVDAPVQLDAGPLIERLSTGQLPHLLRLDAQGLTLDTDGALYRRLAASGWWGTAVDALACGDPKGLRSEVLQAIGRSSIKANVEFRLRLHEATGRLALYLDIMVPGLAATTADAGLMLERTTLPEDAASPVAALSPELTSLRLRYTDLGFNEARNYYCAAQLDVKMEAFVERHIAAVREALDAPAPKAPDAAAIAGYRGFAIHGGDILVDLMPTRPIPLQTLRSMSRAALVEATHPRLAINGHRVQTQAAIRLLDEPPGHEPAIAKAAPTAADPAPIAIPVAQTSAHVGATVRVQTRDGATQTGVITAADTTALTLRRRLEGGYMSYTIAAPEIERILQLRPAPQ